MSTTPEVSAIRMSPVRTAARLEWDAMRRSRLVTAVVLATVVGTVALSALYGWVAGAVAAEGLAVTGPELHAFVLVKGSLAPAASAFIGAWVGSRDQRSRALALVLVRVPKRGAVLGAKLAVSAACAAALAGGATAGAGAVAAMLGGDSAAQVGVAGVVLLGLVHAFVTVSWALLGCALGVVTRSALGAAGVLAGVVVVFEPAVQALAGNVGGWARDASAWLPSSVTTAAQVPAGEGEVVLFGALAGSVAPAAALVALCGYATLAVCAARRRFVLQDV